MVSMFLTISGGKQNNCCNGEWRLVCFWANYVDFTKYYYYYYLFNDYLLIIYLLFIYLSFIFYLFIIYLIFIYYLLFIIYLFIIYLLFIIIKKSDFLFNFGLLSV